MAQSGVNHTYTHHEPQNSSELKPKFTRNPDLSFDYVSKPPSLLNRVSSRGDSEDSSRAIADQINARPPKPKRRKKRRKVRRRRDQSRNHHNQSALSQYGQNVILKPNYTETNSVVHRAPSAINRLNR